ncbi:TrbM/KikA/MpfK family conjugal transfer protein [Alcaligenes sp. GCM10023179]|uniref:TrbM/KikA/MpfK family conjugal transfer protein n=1 Tax=Alcaligenes sp. GCM10023179 TaxID=3252633 RepID=UPI00360C4467
MKQLPISLGALALACASTSYAQSSEVLTGLPGLACEAVLCLSSSLQPGECTASFDHYFDIRKYAKGMLDWEATVDARRFFLGMCPVASEPGMSVRMDAISRGAGKCDPDYLNATYGQDIYRYRMVGSNYLGIPAIRDLSLIKTVTLTKLPNYCVVYNDHEWTYDLSIKYVGDPNRGGYWAPARDYVSAQSKWNAEHTGSWANNWHYSFEDPRRNIDDTAGTGNNH